MPKSKILMATAMLFTSMMSSCAAAKSTAPTTTFGTVAPTVATLQTIVTTPTATTPLTPVLATVATSPPTQVSTSSSASSSTTDYEVVAGIFTTKTAAQSQIDKLSAATFTGFSIKVVGAKFAAVLPNLSKADATALAAKINTAAVATATIFLLTSFVPTITTTVTSPSSTNYEVVDGIYTTQTAAQAQIDKLTNANFANFTIKPITGKFAVVHAGLTQAAATDLMTKIDAANLGPSRIKAL